MISKSTLIAAAVAAVMFGTQSPAFAQKPAPLATEITVCTGATDGNYYWAASQIAVQTKGSVIVTPVATAGSLDNLAKLDNGTCTAAIVQSDSVNVYKARNPTSQLSIEVAAPLYQELLHLFCNKAANLSKITGLNKDTTVLVGPNGSGSSVTWDSLKLSDPARYGVVPTLPIGGLRAINRVKLGEADAACLLSVSGIKSPALMELNGVAATTKGVIELIPANDSDLLKLKSPGKNGKPIYQPASIPSGTYPALQTGVFGSSVATVSTTAVFVVSGTFIDDHAADYDKLLRGVNGALPAIHNRVDPK